MPSERTAANLVSFISDLPIPKTARPLDLRDTFVDPAGQFHNQGSLEAAVELDSASFDAALKKARLLGYEEVAAYKGSQRFLAIELARGGLFRLQGEFGKNFALAVLNPDSRVVSVNYVRTTGMP